MSGYADRAANLALPLLGIAVVVLSLFVVFQTIHVAIAIRSPLLQLDEWRVLPRYLEFMSGELSLLSFLWEDHFGHRPALARLLFILDIAVAGGTQALTKTVSLILCGLTAALFAMLLLRQKQLPMNFRLIGAGLLVLVFLPTQQIYNFFIGWNNAILTTVWFVVFALYLLVTAIKKPARGKWAVLLFGCALLSGFLATISMANGLLIWPIMFVICARFRHWSWATIVALAGAIMITAYLWNSQRSGLLLDVLKQPSAYLQFLAAFLGNPAILLGRTASTLFGALALLLVGYQFFRQSWRTDRDSPIVWFLLGVCLFATGTAAMTSLGRLTFGAEVGVDAGAVGPLALRYYSFISPLWASVLLLGFIQLSQNAENSPGNAWAVLDSAALVVSIGMCAIAYLTGSVPGRAMFDLHDRSERAATAVVVGAPDPVALKFIYPFPDINIFLSVPYLASNRLSVFRSDVDYFLYQQASSGLHKPLSGGMSRDGKWCVGSIDEINKVADAGHAGATWNQISGWTLNGEMERAADGILFADAAGRLVGIGRMLRARSDADRTLNLKHAKLMVDYFGYVEIGAGQPVTGYVFRADRNDLCRFGEKIRPF